MLELLISPIPFIPYPPHHVVPVVMVLVVLVLQVVPLVLPVGVRLRSKDQPRTDPENYVDQRLLVHHLGRLILLVHPEIAAQGQQTVTARLMLRSDPRTLL